MRIAFLPLIVLVIGSCITVSAHPHIFLDVSVDLLFDERGLQGIRNHWVYDEMSTQMFLTSIDLDKNGKISPQELPFVKKDVLMAPSNSRYFNHTVGIPLPTQKSEIKELSASVVKGKMTLDFIIPAPVVATTDYTMLLLVVTDPTLYTSLTIDLEKALVKAPSNIEVEYFVDSVADVSEFKGLPGVKNGLYLRFKKK